MSKQLAKDLERMHGLVWNFRKYIEPYWPTPNYLDSLRYAFTECAEAMDAYLRQQRPNDSRNHDKETDFFDELADCAIMLFTALDLEFLKEHYQEYDTFYIWFNAIVPETYRLETLCIKVTEAMLSARNDEDETSSIYLGWISATGMALGWLATYPEFDLEETIKSRLFAIANKRLVFLDADKAVDIKLKAMPWIGDADWRHGSQ